MTGRALPLLQPTLRMWQLLRACYRGQSPVTVLGRGLEMLASADGHLYPDGRIKTARDTERARRQP